MSANTAKGSSSYVKLLRRWAPRTAPAIIGLYLLLGRTSSAWLARLVLRLLKGTSALRNVVASRVAKIIGGKSQILDSRGGRPFPCVGCGAEMSVKFGYCSKCFDEKSLSLKADKLPDPVVPQGTAIRTFNGEMIHILQVGLGTNSTFLQLDKQWIVTLLGASSRKDDGDILGIGIDANGDSVAPLEKIASYYPTCAVLLAAVGESSGQIEFFCLPRGARKAIRAEMEGKPDMDIRKKERVDLDLQYLENMSSVGAPTKTFQERTENLRKDHGFQTELIEKRVVPQMTFEDVLKKHDAKGCEVLLLDTEGADCGILRSVMSACESGRTPWPLVVHFETRGYANKGEHRNMEEETVIKLQEHGYLLVMACGDTTMVHGPSLRTNSDFAKWVIQTFKLTCYYCEEVTVLPLARNFTKRTGSGFSQWVGSAEDREDERKALGTTGLSASGKWCCADCLYATKFLAELEGPSEDAQGRPDPPSRPVPPPPPPASRLPPPPS